MPKHLSSVFDSITQYFAVCFCNFSVCGTDVRELRQYGWRAFIELVMVIRCVDKDEARDVYKALIVDRK